ncbi:hypothetical protein, conserved [Plasmodium gonderi]|uniref:histone acetyltransferase n=1 Tax=Plasmodium gonderi TaxID=77519 RepID=A0A1Y1JPU8_PLAGO|nr:hypothetical protein, conserved [Plasmodium gonderi]GAW83505.1 hypothetical protein, conserved [Plasmodium gonderi]
MDGYNTHKEMNLNFINCKNSNDANMNSRNRKSNFMEFQYGKVVNNVLGLFKKQNKQRFVSTSSALRSDMHEQILSSRLFLDLSEDREILLHKILKKINILNLIYFRFLKDTDIDDVFDLHKELFPVKYQADFYFSICNFDDNKIIDDEVTRISEKISRSLRSNVTTKRYGNNCAAYRSSITASPKEVNPNGTTSEGIHKNGSNSEGVNGSSNEGSDGTRNWNSMYGLNLFDFSTEDDKIKKDCDMPPCHDNDYEIEGKKCEESIEADKNSYCNDDDLDNISNKKVVNSEDCNLSNHSLDTDNDVKKKINKKWKEEEIFSIGAFLPFSFIDYVNSDSVTKLIQKKTLEKVNEKEILIDYIKFMDECNNMRNNDPTGDSDTNSVDTTQSANIGDSSPFTKGNINRTKPPNKFHNKSDNYTNASAKCFPTICFSQSTQNEPFMCKGKRETFSKINHKENEYISNRDCKIRTPHNWISYKVGHNLCSYNGIHLDEYLKKNDILKEKDNDLVHKNDNNANDEHDEEEHNDGDEDDDDKGGRRISYTKEENNKKYCPSVDKSKNDVKLNNWHCGRNNSTSTTSLENNKDIENSESVNQNGNIHFNNYPGNHLNHIYDNNRNIQDIYKQLKEKSIEYEENNDRILSSEILINRLRDKIYLNKETLNLYNYNKKRIKKDYLVGSISNLINYQDARNEKDFINIYNHFKKKSDNSKKGKNYLKYMYDSSMNFLENYIPLDKNGNISSKEKNTPALFNNPKKMNQSELHSDCTFHMNGKNANMKTSSRKLINGDDEKINDSPINPFDMEKKEHINLNNALNDLSVLRSQHVNKNAHFVKKLYEEIYMNENIKQMTKKYIKKKINSIYILTVGISEYFRGLNLASYLIEYTVFYFYFIIYRMFLYNNKFYCYIDNNLFYSICTDNLRDEYHDEIFDDGLLTDNSSDDFYSILSDEKSLSDKDYKHRYSINGKGEILVREIRNCLETENKLADDKQNRQGGKICEKENQRKNEDELGNLKNDGGNDEFDNSQTDERKNEPLPNSKINYINTTKRSCFYGHHLDENDIGRKNSDKRGDNSPLTFKTHKMNRMNDHINRSNKHKNTWNSEKSKNYSISNGVLRECYKQIILNDYLYHLYAIIHNKNAEMLVEKEVQNGEAKSGEVKKLEIPKGGPFPPLLKFPIFKNPLYCSNLSCKILDLFLNNFCAFNLKDRPFFQVKNFNRKKLRMDYNDENASLPLYMYLHVIDYNKAAINLYNKLSFDYICTYDNFYDINKTTFSSYLYAYFF